MGQPVASTKGRGGGVMLCFTYSAQLQELYLKGVWRASSCRSPGPPAGGAQDREFVAMDGRTMVLRWLNPEVQNCYATGVYVRCGAEGASRKTPAKRNDDQAATAVALRRRRRRTARLNILCDT
jgi:hypothetical protein